MERPENRAARPQFRRAERSPVYTSLGHIQITDTCIWTARVSCDAEMRLEAERIRKGVLHPRYTNTAALSH
jgi:hypothetical protein